MSQPSEIQIYFQKIAELADSGEEFPVDLDEVWPLVYSRKDVAVKTLEKSFVESIDYQPLHQNVEQTGSGGQNKVTYMLSVSCLEYFIARKIKRVFEVYRQVFHAVRTKQLQQQPVTGDYLILVGQRMKELETKIELDKPKVEFAEVAMRTTDINLLT